MIFFVALLLMTLQGLPGFRNLDFEQGKAGAEPPGWRVSEGFRIKLEATGAKQGKFCASLEKTDRNAAFGALSQLLDAKPYLGKRITLRSFVRTEASIPSNHASLFLAVYRADRSEAAYNNNDSYIIKTDVWTEYEITIDVPADGVELYFGIILTGDGKAFWDDVRVEVVEISDQANEPPAPLEGRALENVIAFARLLGYVRYFYPGEDIDKVNWNQFAIDGMRIVEKMPDSVSLAASLQDWARTVAPTVCVFPTERSKENRESFNLPKEGAIAKVYWKHQGPPGGKSNADCIRSERVHAYFKQEEISSNELPDPKRPFYSDLGGGVSCLMPIALYEDTLGILPRVANPLLKKAPPRAPGFFPSGKDRATRLAGVALAWNVFQHFYPYFEEVKADWMGVLSRALKRAASDVDEPAFVATLRSMLVPLQDGHARVHWLKDTNAYIPPIAWDWIEGQLVITRVVDESKILEILPGDIVQTVDGVPSAKKLIAVEEEISSPSSQWKRYSSLRQVLEGSLNSQIEIQIQSRNGLTSSIRLMRTVLRGSTQWEKLQELCVEKIEEKKPGIFYVNIGKISNDEFKNQLPVLQKAKGIIFDLRGYPWAINEIFLQHLIKKPAQVPGAYMPIVCFPDQHAIAFTDDLDELLVPEEPFLDAKVVFLAGGGTISMAESYLTIVEANALGAIIGSTTAATNGVTSSFVLPGDFQIVWTAMKMTKPHGIRFHGIGIAPTHAVERSIGGAAELRDEILDYAIRKLDR